MLNPKQILIMSVLSCMIGMACSSPPSPPPAMTTTTIPSMGRTIDIPAGWVGHPEQDGSISFTPSNPAQYRGRNSLQSWPGVAVPQSTTATPMSIRAVTDGSLEFTVYESEAIVGGQQHRMEAWVYSAAYGEAVRLGMGSLR